MDRILISICGRAGSTGFPGKNLALFADAPLSYYSVAAAELFAKRQKDAEVDIVLSTDSEQLIDDVTRAFDIQVLRRPAHLCDNVIPKLAVYTHALTECERLNNKTYDYFIDLDITSPIRTVEDIERQLRTKKEQKDKQLIFSAVKSRRNPYYNLVACDSDGVVTKAIEKSDFFARQEIPETYDLNASIYVFEATFVRDNTSHYIWDARCGLSLMPDTGVLDIDSKEDFELMQAVATHLFKNSAGCKEIHEYVLRLASTIKNEAKSALLT